MQSDFLDAGWYRPFPHIVHSLTPVLLYLPGGHKPVHVSTVRPMSFPYVPAGHNTQSEKDADPSLSL